MSPPAPSPTPYPLLYCEPGERNGQPPGTIYLWDGKLSSPDFVITADEAATVAAASVAPQAPQFFVATADRDVWEPCRYPASQSFVGTSDMPTRFLEALGLSPYQISKIQEDGDLFRVSWTTSGWQLNGTGFDGYKLQTKAST